MLKEMEFFKKLTHGGNVYKIAQVLDKKPEKIIDLSASTNPLLLSAKFKKKLFSRLKSLLNSIDRYPDPEASLFRKTIAEKYGISEEGVLCGNGSTELLYLSLRAINPEKVLIPEPTFIEYYRASQIQGVKKILRSFALTKEEFFENFVFKLEKEKPQLAFFCNPNNPTGWVVEKKTLLKVVKEFPETFFLLDEAFVEFCEKETLLREAQNLNNLAVFRSMTKFFGLAGLRLGYLVASPYFVKKLKKIKEPWSVNSFAQELGIYLLKNKKFFKDTFLFFKKEREYVQKFFYRSGIKFFPSVTNFLLFRIAEGLKFTYKLAKKGILLRNCHNFYGLDENYIRISIKTRKENRLFIRELKNYLKELETYKRSG